MEPIRPPCDWNIANILEHRNVRRYSMKLHILSYEIAVTFPSPIIRGWYNRPVVAAVPIVPPHKLKKKKKTFETY
jgi:hypothetical protein